MTSLTDTIAALDDAAAVQVLADVAGYQTRLPGPARLIHPVRHRDLGQLVSIWSAFCS